MQPRRVTDSWPFRTVPTLPSQIAPGSVEIAEKGPETVTRAIGRGSVSSVAGALAVLDRRHAEPKSATADGTTCIRQTVGLLQRRPVYGATLTLIGKEANEVDAGVAHDWGEVRNEYGTAGNDIEGIPGVLASLSIARIAHITELSESTIRRLKHRRAHHRTRSRLLSAGADVAHRTSLAPLPLDDRSACEVFAALPATARRNKPECKYCSNSLRGSRATYCCPACRQAAYRSRKELT